MPTSQEFELFVDLETAANDATRQSFTCTALSPARLRPIASKADADASPILIVAIQSNTRSLLELSETADLTVKEMLTDNIRCK